MKSHLITSPLIFAHVWLSSRDFYCISLCGLYLLYSFLLLSFSFRISSFSFFRFEWTNAFLSCRFELFLFAPISYVFYSLFFSLSCLPIFFLSVPFFILLAATFTLVHRVWWLLSPPSSFSCHSSPVRQNLRSLLFPPLSFFLLIRRLRRSLSIPRRSRRRFPYCICSPLFSLPPML